MNKNTQEHWNMEQYQNYINKAEKSASKSKYGAKKTNIDGHVFDSLKEANYYQELKLQLEAKAIKGFCLQPIFILASNLIYKADFIVFNNDDTVEIVDVKGFKTKEYKVKKKVFEEKFNLKIKEI